MIEKKEREKKTPSFSTEKSLKNQMTVVIYKTQTLLLLGIYVFSIFCFCIFNVMRRLRAFDPRQDKKTNNVAVRPAKTQISLAIYPRWSESSLGAHSLCWFCHVVGPTIVAAILER